MADRRGTPEVIGEDMTSVTRRLIGWIRWQRISVQELRIRDSQKETAIVFGYTTFYILAAWGVGNLIKHNPLPILGSADFITDVWYALVFKIGLLLVVPAIWFFHRGYRFKDLLPEWTPGFKSIRTIIIVYIVGFCLNLFHGDLNLAKVASQFSSGELVVRVVIGIVLPLFMAGIPEEVVYRGILQTRLEKLLGRVPAICVTAVMFAAWHLPSRYLLSKGVEGSAGDLGSVLIGTGIPVFVVGLIFGLLWDRYRSLLPLIAAHWGIDTLPTVFSFLGIHF
jgi:membrane protease YdiL (CAAX protease family)